MHHCTICDKVHLECEDEDCCPRRAYHRDPDYRGL
jgi:hypothetical protein